MAKVIKKKSTRGKVKHTVKIDGKTHTIETARKCFGSIGMDLETGDIKLPNCKGCVKQTPLVAQACMVKSDPKIKVNYTAKKGGTRGPRKSQPWEYVILELDKGTGRKELIQACVEEKGMSSESAARDLVSRCSCCVGAWHGKSRKKNGTVALYTAWLKGGKKGEEPKGDKSSKRTVERVHEVLSSKAE